MCFVSDLLLQNLSYNICLCKTYHLKTNVIENVLMHRNWF
jgi:hypothetical protein